MLALWLALVEADSLALVEAESEDSSLLLGNVIGLPFIEVAALVEADSLADVLALVEAESEDSSL